MTEYSDNLLPAEEEAKDNDPMPAEMTVEESMRLRRKLGEASLDGSEAYHFHNLHDPSKSTW
jgi:hypothetical protein